MIEGGNGARGERYFFFFKEIDKVGGERDVKWSSILKMIFFYRHKKILFIFLYFLFVEKRG